jgi:hypothetical protein
MRKAGAVILLLLMGLPLLSAQEEDEDPSVEIDWGDFTNDLYAPGDQIITISLGTVFPTVFLNNGNVINHNFTPPVGGIGFLSFGYFLSSHFFVGGEIGGMFLFTLGKDTLFCTFIGARGGYQFNFWKLEFPLTAVIGMTWHSYLNHLYYGLYVKGGVAAFFRATSEWSFGLATDWSWLPEWPGNKAQNVDGNVLDIMISARYHF